MCMSCGCGEVDAKHEDDRNIVMDDLKKAAEAAGISPEEAAQNIASASKQTAGSSS